MRTTVDIDNPILILAKQVAQAQKKTLGELISESLYKNLKVKPEKQYSLKEKDTAYVSKTGFPTLKPSAEATPISNEDIKKMMEELGI